MGQCGQAHLRVKLELSPRPAPDADRPEQKRTARPRPGGVALSRSEAVAQQWLAPVPPVMTQTDAGHGSDDIESRLALDADRLQGERIVEPADEAVRAGADADRGSRRSADKSAGERALPDPRRRREHRPGQTDFVGEADLRPEARNIRLVKLRRRAARRRKDTVENARREYNVASRPRASAAQHAYLDIGLRRRRR